MAKAKQYIGNGKAMKFNGVMVSLRMEEARKYIRTTDNGEYLTFFIDPRKTADQWGRTHNAYVLVNTPEEAPQATLPEPAMAAEADPEVVHMNGRRLRRISPEEAAARRAAMADMQLPF